MALQRLMMALSLVGLTTSSVTAGQITSLFGTGGAATVLINTNNNINNVHTNNYLADGTISPNFQTVAKAFTAVGPFDMTFNVINSGGLTSYFFDETVKNNTNVTWYDFHFILGTGGLAFADNPFVPSAAGASTTFDGTFTPFGSMQVSAKTFVTVDYLAPSAIAPGQTATFKVQLVVRDNTNGPYTFTLRQTPSVPEPSSVIVLGIGLVGMWKVVLPARRKFWSAE